MTFFEYYEALADSSSDFTLMAGRYGVQRGAERRIVMDVAEKLDLNPSDRLLDIGCGGGNIAVPVSFLVERITCIDNPASIRRLEERFPNAANVVMVQGDFLKLLVNDSFTKVLIYSVLHCLPSSDQVLQFVEKALDLLEPGGKMLIGDIPNSSKKERFTRSRNGKKFVEEWNRRLSENASKESIPETAKEKIPVTNSVIFDDPFIFSLMSRIRKSGYEAFLLPQPEELPFGHTREDILVVRLD